MKESVDPLVQKVNLDWSGKMAHVKGEVCESWLSSAVEDGSKDDDGEDENDESEMPQYSGLGSDGNVLSKPIRKLRKLFKCDVGL